MYLIKMLVIFPLGATLKSESDTVGKPETTDDDENGASKDLKRQRHRRFDVLAGSKQAYRRQRRFDGPHRSKVRGWEENR